MNKNIFVNLPVKDLDRSRAYFAKLGYTFNPQFTDETAACMVISENIFAMLITHARFSDFTPKAIADSETTTEVLIALSCDSREEVAKIADAALAAGAVEAKPPQDYGFMTVRSLSDPDGHIWEYMWMDPAHVQS